MFRASCVDFVVTDNFLPITGYIASLREQDWDHKNRMRAYSDSVWGDYAQYLTVMK